MPTRKTILEILFSFFLVMAIAGTKIACGGHLPVLWTESIRLADGTSLTFDSPKRIIKIKNASNHRVGVELVVRQSTKFYELRTIVEPKKTWTRTNLYFEWVSSVALCKLGPTNNQRWDCYHYGKRQ